MSEMTEIILRLLWRFYPIAWLTTAIVRGLSCITPGWRMRRACSSLAVSQKTAPMSAAGLPWPRSGSTSSSS